MAPTNHSFLSPCANLKMVVRGRDIAETVRVRTALRVQHLSRPPRVVAVVTNETPATKSYLKIKERYAAQVGILFEIQHFPPTTSVAELQRSIAAIDADAVIVQLPLAEGMPLAEVCDAIQLNKDADVLSAVARRGFTEGYKDSLLPPIVGAVKEILNIGNVDPIGKHSIMIGDGFLVGAPAATWLRQQGAFVEVVTLETGNLAEALMQADIVVSGAGSPHLIKPSMLKQGVVLIDAGTAESNGVIVGDADPACADVASLFTPVPGGVGPITVACLFENVVRLVDKPIDTGE